MKDKDLMLMSVDQLWNLHEEIVAVLSTKIDAEKQELLSAIHEQLDHAISYNLWTGLAYGTYRLLFLFCTHV